MQYRNRTGNTLKLFVILAEGFQRLPATLEHCSEYLSLVLPCQRSKLFGNGKGDHKIIGWDLLPQLSLQPLLALVRLAMRAVPMTA